MREASAVLAEARALTAKGNIDGAIRLLREELSQFTGKIEERRAIVTLLLAYYGRRERISEGIQLAEQYLQNDSVSVIDSSLKARLVMNYAALKAAAGSVSEAETILADILLCSQSEDVAEDDLGRVSTLLESLRIGERGSTAEGSESAGSLGGRVGAYLASARTYQLIRSASYDEAVRLARATLADNADLEDGALKIALMLNLGSALTGAGNAEEAGEWFRKSYELAIGSVIRSGTLFALVAQSYATWPSEAGEVGASIEILENLLEAQLTRLGDANAAVTTTKALLENCKVS